MVNDSDMYNLVHYEVAKVADELQDIVIFVWIISHTFLILPLQENKFRISICYICVCFIPSFYTTSEEVQTYPTGMSPVASGVTHDTAYVISAM